MADHIERLDLLSSRPVSVLVTLKRDGRPQLSNVTHHYEPSTRTVSVSVTDSRAKTKNLRRDPRVSLHVSTADGGTYVVAEGTAELTPVAQRPDGDTVQALVALYRAIGGEHPDWDQYRTVMVDEGRLVMSFVVEHSYGWSGW